MNLWGKASILTEFRTEAVKLLRKSRTYIGPVAMAILVVLLTIGLKYSHHVQYMEHGLEKDFYTTGSPVNAAFLSRLLLGAILYTFLPIFVCMVCGDVIASEAADGTLRTLLSRPVTRLRVVLSKYVVGIFYVFALTFGAALFAYLVGAVFLGRGSLVVIEDGIWIIPETSGPFVQTAVFRLGAAYVLGASGMLAVGSIAFAVSTVLSNSNGAIVTAMGVFYGSAIIGEIEFFAGIKPYLLTTYLQNWGKLFAGPPDLLLLAKSIGVLLLYSLVALAIGAAVFNRKDVLV